MAQREDIKSRIRQVNPQAIEMTAEIDRILAKHGITNIVELTEDMTEDEQEMAIYAELLKEGYAAEEADRAAKRKLALFNSVFGS